MRARLFVDSGAWIALSILRDQHHAETESSFRAALDRRIVAVMEASSCTHVLGFDGDFAAAGFSLWRAG